MILVVKGEVTAVLADSGFYSEAMVQAVEHQTMNPELKKYLAEIGGRGGSATTEKKASAVGKRGALGGRPRKDGRQPGSKTLEDVFLRIEGSDLPKAAKRDLRSHRHELMSATVHLHPRPR